MSHPPSRSPNAAEGRTASRRAAVLAWALAAGCFALFAYAAAAGPTDPDVGVVFEILFGLGFLVFPVAGAFLAWRRPTNVIGWLFLLVGLASSIGIAADAYVLGDPARPGAQYAVLARVLTLDSAVFFTSFVFFLLLFPNGRIPGPRWRHLARFSLVVSSLVTILLVVVPGTAEFGDLELERSPLALDAFRPLAALEAPLFFAVILCVPAAAIAFVLQFRRSRGIERQQLKWFALSAVILGITLLLAPVLWALDPVLGWLWPLFFIIAITSFPVATAVAILRHRLYDIDRIISRTVSYAAVSALLGGTFALMVLLPPVLLGGDQPPDYVIALATLVVASLFRPVRRRVQEAVDHRFNRRRYDAERTIEAFTARLREQLDIDALGAELRDVVGQTMQPTHVSVWLRPGARK